MNSPSLSSSSSSSSNNDDDDDNQTPQQQQQPPATHVLTDCHLLCGFDPSPSPYLVIGKRPNKQLITDDAKTIQTLIDSLFSLPSPDHTKNQDSTTVTLKKIVLLPDQPTIIRLPRHKPLPQPKPETRWEKFAREKGIQKTKRDRLVFDKHAEEYLPRFGPGRSPANNPPIIELKQTDEPGIDPFEKMNLDKKMSKLKQRSRELKNIDYAQQTSNKKKGKTSTNQLVVDPPPEPQPKNFDFVVPETKRGQKRTLQALKHVQTSTASHGRFDREQKDEPKRNVSGEKRRKFEPNLPTTTTTSSSTSTHTKGKNKNKPLLEDEKNKNLKILEKMKA
jgi:regulator of ribosome biosynthesis